MLNLVLGIMLSKKNFWLNKKILITGNTGFKGSWLTIALKEVGANIVGISNKKNNNFTINNYLKLNKIIRQYYKDVTNYKALEKIILKEKPDIIFHLAAQPIVKYSYNNPYETFCINSLGTVNLLEIIKKFKHKSAFVNITTDKVYKQTGKNRIFQVEDHLGGNDVYSASKACSDIMSNAYYKSFFLKKSNIGIATARAGNVIGGFDWAKNRIIPDFFRSIEKNNSLTIRMPNSVRPWQHIIDVINGYMILAEKLYKMPKKFSKSWNFGPKKNSSKPVIKLIKKLNQINTNRAKIILKKSNFHEEKSIRLDSKNSIKELKWKQKIKFSDSVMLTSEIYQKFFSKNLKYEDFKKQIKKYIK